MKSYKLDPEEEQILKDIEEGKYISVDNFEEAKREAEEAARNTLKKNKNINIRLSFKDVQKLKRKAAEKGLPYQTLVSSIIHQYVNDDLRVEL